MAPSRTGRRHDRRPRIAAAAVSALVLLVPASIVAAGDADGSAAEAVRVSWSLDGQVDPRSVAVEAFDGRTIEVVVEAASSAVTFDGITSVSLSCRDRDSGETGSAPLAVLGRSTGNESGAATSVLTVATGDAVAGLPYAIEPLAIASKPSAIIAQLAGRSVVGIAPARLREGYRDTAAYMLTTAGHHYPLPYGDGVLQCRLETESEVGGAAAGVATRAASAGFDIIIGRGAPEGPYPRDRAVLPTMARPFWVADPTALPADVRAAVLAAAEAGDVAAPAAAGGPVAALRRWDDGSAVAPWMEVALDVIASDGENPVRASRSLAMAAVAANDALLALDTIRAATSTAGSAAAPDRLEHAVVAAAVAPVLRALYPGSDALIDAAVGDAAAARSGAGLTAAIHEDAAGLLGEWVAGHVIERGAGDGSDVAWEGAVPEGPDLWRSSIADDTPPLEPLAGTWRPWNVDDGSELRPPPPPRPGDATFEAELREILEVSRGLTSAEEQIASQWQDKDGSLTPAGHWTAIAIGLLREEGWSSSRAATLLSLLATAQADAFITSWDSKFAFWSIRPITVMQAIEPGWRPYVDTPHFPSYVSGHATTSGAAGAVLAAAFPALATELTACSQQAADSRLLGGIHFRTENEVGLELGRQVAAHALERVTLPDILPQDGGRMRSVGYLWPAS